MSNSFKISTSSKNLTSAIQKFHSRNNSNIIIPPPTRILSSFFFLFKLFLIHATLMELYRCHLILSFHLIPTFIRSTTCTPSQLKIPSNHHPSAWPRNCEHYFRSNGILCTPPNLFPYHYYKYYHDFLLITNFYSLHPQISAKNPPGLLPPPWQRWQIYLQGGI